MDREDILRESRNENRGQDEMEREVWAQAGMLAAKVGGLVCAVMLFLDTILTERVNNESWAVYCTIYGIICLIPGMKLKKKSEFFFGIILLVCAALNLLFYIKGLIG